MAKKRRFTTQIIAKNILKKFFVSLFWSVILMITVTIQWMLQSHQVWSRLDSKQKNQMLVKINSNWRTLAIVTCPIKVRIKIHSNHTIHRYYTYKEYVGMYVRNVGPKFKIRFEYSKLNIWISELEYYFNFFTL